MNGERLRIRTAPRDPERFPEEDEALGRSVFTLLAGALVRGLPRPAFLLVFEDRVDQVDALEILRRPAEAAHTMLSALAGMDGVRCAGLVGVLRASQGRASPVRAAVVYLEWPDNRWWTAWQPMDEDRMLLGDGPVVRAAVDGWPKPGGVGAWFSTARRLELRMKLTRVEEEREETVH